MKKKNPNVPESMGKKEEKRQKGSKACTFSHQLNEELFSDSAFDLATEDTIRFDGNRINRAPLRVRLILKGLVNGNDAAQVNAALLEHDCPKLYARSYREAVLIYALDHHLNLSQYQALQRRCDMLRDTAQRSQWLPSSAVTSSFLRKYVAENSATEGTRLVTGSLTKQLAEKLSDVATDDALLQMLEENLASFSEVREKTRYYFCKYLLYYLDSRVEDYLSAKRSKIGFDFAEEQLGMLFRFSSYLKRHKSESDEDLRKKLEEAPISLAGIFDDFSYFYFYYNVQSWTELLCEAYGGDVAAIPPYLKEKYLRSKHRPLRSDLDREVAEQMRMHEATEDATAATERCGETALRKYFRGQLDMDRTTFLCFLIFFAVTSQVPAGQQLHERRIDEILGNCGFPTLRQEQPLDAFVCRFLQYGSLHEAWDYLTEEINCAVTQGDDSFLYRTYRSSRNYYDDLDAISTPQQA